uniref:von Willebrand factor A domain containing 3A n=1 Tax=Varanus komodoensis TaxID=61221 RepID=A0A8D2J4S5_VARKO
GTVKRMLTVYSDIQEIHVACRQSSKGTTHMESGQEAFITYHLHTQLGGGGVGAGPQHAMRPTQKGWMGILTTQYRTKLQDRRTVCISESPYYGKAFSRFVLTHAIDYTFVYIFPSSLQELRLWVQELKPSGGCNLLKALKKVLVVKELDSLVIIVGSCPDQASGILSDYIQQCTAGRKLLIHTVTYDCSSHVPPVSFQRGEMAHWQHTHFNCDSNDIQLVLLERQKATSLLNIVNEIGSMECLTLPAESCILKPPKHESLLAIQMPGLLAKTSAEWLRTNGLKAKKLSLYQVLAPNAFSPVEEFVPVLQKTVSSTLHEKAMMQFEWHDGTVKNVHVDPPILYDYQKRLGKMMRMYERRVDWLSRASRRMWGTVCEKRVVFLVDVSRANAMYIIHIQHSLRLLLEEQMSNKDFFNIIAFGSNVKTWQPELVPASPENLQNAWRWILTLQCEGTRNVMNVLRRAVEVDLKEKDKHESQSLYLFTTGIPDQETHTICSYMLEVCGGCDLQLHVCLFSVSAVDPGDNVLPRYANLNETAATLKDIAQAATGRFHWFGETGIYESDDISLIFSEMEKAVNYSQKVDTRNFSFSLKFLPSPTAHLQTLAISSNLWWWSFPQKGWAHFQIDHGCALGHLVFMCLSLESPTLLSHLWDVLTMAEIHSQGVLLSHTPKCWGYNSKLFSLSVFTQAEGDLLAICFRVQP